jgi:hypothetical protein
MRARCLTGLAIQTHPMRQEYCLRTVAIGTVTHTNENRRAAVMPPYVATPKTRTLALATAIGIELLDPAAYPLCATASRSCTMTSRAARLSGRPARPSRAWRDCSMQRDKHSRFLNGTAPHRMLRSRFLRPSSSFYYLSSPFRSRMNPISGLRS